ncbi:conserved Plasmodium protein, unknown function [Plasmodium relictum]|uniref:Intein C-terminal splicing domain-containing protein n=1 Tax=Plasmodium relictum TaxID=85471 RepID=A0A1J1H513_PLARL|nr:conserved Plasmodium protein, unknown function [Plasmodium relictum]CRG99643.1 conserved Plasmodium protein, unknown function [Plasmodium relictum]
MTKVFIFFFALNSFFSYIFTCIHVEDTFKIKLNKINTGDFLRICCNNFCSYLRYDVTKKTYLLIKENITSFSCKNTTVKLYYSNEHYFYFSHFIYANINQVNEFVDSFENEKKKIIFWKPFFEFIEIKKGKKYIYKPLGYYQKRKYNNQKKNFISKDKLNDYNNGVPNTKKFSSDKKKKNEDTSTKNDNINFEKCKDYLKKYNKNNICNMSSLIQNFKELVVQIKKEKIGIFDNSLHVTENYEYTNNIINNNKKNSGNIIEESSSFHKIYKNYLMKIVLTYNPIFLFLFEDQNIWNFSIKKINTSLDTDYKKKGLMYKKNYKVLLRKEIVILIFIILIILIQIFLKRKKCKIKAEKYSNKKNKIAENRLAEIHVEYNSKIQTNVGSKIKDITDEDLINLMAHNKAEIIIVCQP